MEKRLQPYKHQCSVSQEGSYTALGMKACSKVKKQKSTFPFLLLKNVAKISAEIAQSIVIFSFLCMLYLRVFLEGDEEITAGSGYHGSVNAGHRAVFFFGFVQVLIILHTCSGLSSLTHTSKVGCLLDRGI